MNDTNFQEVLSAADIPILLDFWATWCGPCKAITPFINELEKQYKDKIKVMKIDVDKNPLIASTFGVRSIPTLIVYDKVVIDGHSGMISKEGIEKLIKKVIK